MRGNHRFLFAATGIFAVVLLLLTAPAFAQLRLDVTRGKVEPMPIAVPPLPAAAAKKRRPAATWPR